MEDRRHTEPYKSARPSGAPGPVDIETTIKHPLPRSEADERLRGLSIDGRYQVGTCIGAGGMSRVYAGVHSQTGVRVAIKLIDPALSREPSTKQRILSETRAMMELQSNHIVRAHDVGVVPGGQLYVVMEFLDGENLDALLEREGPLPWPRVAAIGAQICSGLTAAHRNHYIHRDIKPQNLIRVAVEGEPELIKIIDFGVAREVRVEAGPTEQGVLPGTPEYMAPELVKQQEVRANVRTDLYALGVTLYKLLTGRLPFQGATYMETLRRHVGEPLTPPSVAAPGRGIPPEADAILGKLLAKDPAARYADARELSAALRPDRRTPSPAEAVEPPPPGPRVAVPLPSPPPPTAPLAGESAATHPSFTPSEITEPPRPHHRRIDRRFVTTRVGTLTVAVALFTGGTFAVRPHAAEPATRLAAATPPASKAPPVAQPEAGASATPESAASATPESAAPSPTPAPATPPADVAADVAADAPPPADPTPAEDPPVLLSEAPIDPEAPPAPVAPPEPDDPAPSSASIEPSFDYNDTRKLIAEQHAFLRNECMTKKAKKPLARLRFRVDVRPNGRPLVSVFSGEKDVRSCVRGLFVFPLDTTPNGAAFEYSLAPSGNGALKPVPVDPEKVKPA
ncbi:MAG: serine/threonine protein kinase [Myxococcales bacterium]|nr:serine/threonine protein kinase [Myxococcales bacterium]